MSPPPNHSIFSPLVIVGSLRSGTTLLRLMLDSHPRVHIFGEFEIATRYLPPAGEADPPNLWRRVESDRQYQDYGFVRPKGADFRSAVYAFAAQMRERGVSNHKPHFGFTIHSKFDRIPELWPAARYIFIVRDPRAVARSVIQMGWAGTAFHASAVWVEAMESLERLRARVGGRQITVIRYEDLLSEPQTTLQNCLSAIVEQYDPRMLGYWQTTTYPPLDASKAGKWRTVMSRRQIEQVDARCGERMSRFGYTPLSVVRRHQYPSRLECIGLDISNKVGTFAWSVRRFGVLLACARAMARRGLVPGMVGRAIKNKVHYINRQHLR